MPLLSVPERKLLEKKKNKTKKNKVLSATVVASVSSSSLSLFISLSHSCTDAPWMAHPLFFLIK